MKRLRCWYGELLLDMRLVTSVAVFSQRGARPALRIGYDDPPITALYPAFETEQQRDHALTEIRESLTARDELSSPASATPPQAE